MLISPSHNLLPRYFRTQNIIEISGLSDCLLSKTKNQCISVSKRIRSHRRTVKVWTVQRFCGYHDFKSDMSQTLQVFFSSLASLFLFTDSSLLMKTAKPFSLTAPSGRTLFFGCSQSGIEHCRR